MKMDGLEFYRTINFGELSGLGCLTFEEGLDLLENGITVNVRNSSNNTGLLLKKNDIIDLDDKYVSLFLSSECNHIFKYFNTGENSFFID